MNNKETYNVVCRDYKYHIVYKTTNTVNNKIYIGIHSTDNLQDNYIGSGYVLKEAIKKYGRDKFIKEVLYTFNTRDEARHMEALIVDEDFIQRKDTYNLTVGGMGVENQIGERNHRYGKPAINCKKVKAEHINGTSIIANSIQELSSLINIDRANIRNLINKNIRGKRGWKVTLVEDIV